MPGSDFTLTGTVHTNAGTYVADAWSFSDPSGNYASQSGTVTDSIGQANAHASVTATAGLVYNGRRRPRRRARPRTFPRATLPGSDFTLTGTVHTNAGTYVADAWSFSDPSGNYASQSGTVTDSIGQATPTVIVTDQNSTQGGTIATPQTTLEGVSGTPVTTLEGESLSLTYYDGSPPSGGPVSPPTTAGIYTVVASFTATTDYASNSDSAAFMIYPAGSLNTSTTISTSAPLGTTYGIAPTFTAIVTSTATPTGNVEFMDESPGGNYGEIGMGVQVGTTTTSATWTLTPGATQLNATLGDTIEAIYEPTGTFNPSSANPTLTQVINQANAHASVAAIAGLVYSGTRADHGGGHGHERLRRELAGQRFHAHGHGAHQRRDVRRRRLVVLRPQRQLCQPERHGDRQHRPGQRPRQRDGDRGTGLQRQRADHGDGHGHGRSGATLPGSDFTLTGTVHTNAGTYVGDAWSFSDPSGNYASQSGTVTDSIGQANAHASVTATAGLIYSGARRPRRRARPRTSPALACRAAISPSRARYTPTPGRTSPTPGRSPTPAATMPARAAR